MKGAQPHVAGFEDAEREQKLKNGEWFLELEWIRNRFSPVHP